MPYTRMNSQIGELVLVSNEDSLLAIYFGMENFSASEHSNFNYEDYHPLLQKVKIELTEYFNKKRVEFSIPITIKGTPFQVSVWKQLQTIPYGETRSYMDIAQSIDNSKAVRAIGQANKANKIPIIIPCHRVIGKNKSLTGYAGTQIDKKEVLLKIEESL